MISFCRASLRQKYFVVFTFMAGTFSPWHIEKTFAQDGDQEEAGAEVSVSRVHPLAGYFTEVGLLSCVVRADQLGTFLAGRVQGQSFVVMQASENPTVVHVSLFVPSEIAIQSADIFFTPGLSNCPASYSVSSLIERDCSAVLEGDPEKEKFVQIGQSGHFFSEIGRGASVRLSPSGNACTRTKSEVVE